MSRGQGTHYWPLYETEPNEEAVLPDPYRQLAYSVLARAILDVVSASVVYDNGNQCRGRLMKPRVRDRAWAWIRSTDQGIYSFSWWCEVAGLIPPKRKGELAWQNKFIAHRRAG